MKKSLIESEIAKLPKLSRREASRWAEEWAYTSLLEDDVENLMNVLPEAIQQEILAWAADRLYASLYFANKLEE